MNELNKNGSGYYDPTASAAMQRCMENERMEYLRGDIYFIRKSRYIAGSEEKEEGRPALIVSNNVGNRHSNICEVVYLTTKKKNPLPTHVSIMCRVPSTALCEQISNVSKERFGEYIRSATDEEMEAIDRALMVSIGLNQLLSNESDASEDTSHELVNELKMKLETAEKTIFDRDTEIHDLTEKLKSARSENKLLNYDASRDLLKAETERDLYKSLYEQMVEKMIG